MNSHAIALAHPVQAWTPPAHPGRRRHLQLVEPAVAGPEPDQRWVRRLTQSVVEVLGGHRAATTLVGSLSPVVYQALRNPEPDNRLRGGQVLTVRSQPLGPDAVEVAAVVGCPARTRALALRLHRRHNRWRCVTIAVL